MGQIYYEMGLLATTEVIEISATDIIGTFVGTTGPKVQSMLDKASGRVLFIDEAYRLAEGLFATEAINELVDSLTKTKYMKKLVVILAGYDRDINRLMAINTGLTSRFPETIEFKSLGSEDCLALLVDALRGKNVDVTILEPPSNDLSTTLQDSFNRLTRLSSWGNARDVKYLAGKIFSATLLLPAAPGAELQLTESVVLDTMQDLVTEREHRDATAKAQATNLPDLGTTLPVQYPKREPPPPRVRQSTSTATAAPAPLIEQAPPSIEEVLQVLPAEISVQEQRDAGVTDEVWQQLQTAKVTAQHLAASRQSTAEQLEHEIATLEQTTKAAAAAAAAAAAEVALKQQSSAQEAAHIQALKQKREAERLALLRARNERERVAREVQEEARVQTKLQLMGFCPMGFPWIKMEGGYRCGGGSHFVGDAQLR